MLYCYIGEILIHQPINSSYICSYFSYFFSPLVLIFNTYSISFILLSADSFDSAIYLIIYSFYCSYFTFEFDWSFPWGFFEFEFWFKFYFLCSFDLFSLLYWATAETMWLGYFFFSIFSNIYAFSFLTIWPDPLYDFGTTFLSANPKSTWADPLFSSAL